MARLLAFSPVVIPLLVALRYSRVRRPRRGLRRTLALTAAFNAAYIVALYYLYFRLA
jgi:hypothetical protein